MGRQVKAGEKELSIGEREKKREKINRKKGGAGRQDIRKRETRGWMEKKGAQKKKTKTSFFSNTTTTVEVVFS